MGIKGQIPWNKGIKTGRLSNGSTDKHWKLSKENCERLSKRMLGKLNPRFNKKPWNYIEDRSLVKRQDKRDNSIYDKWRLDVYKRDNYKCRIDNNDCKGRIIAHHILGFTHYPELRYNINNGITLCHFHHPLKRSEEKRLIPFFQRIVEVINNNLGAHNLAVSELTENLKGKKGEVYVNAVVEEFNNLADEGSEENNKVSSDNIKLKSI